MSIAFGAHRGRVCREYYGGASGVADQYPGLIEFGAGTENERVPTSGRKRINGVTEWQTGGTAGDSHGRYWPDIYRPGIMEDGFLREANGTLIAMAQIAVPSRANVRMFFGIVKDQPGANDNVDTLATGLNADTIAFAEDDFAGFIFSSSFPTSPNNWRLVAAKGGGGITADNVAPVLSDLVVEEYGNNDEFTPGKRPMLELNVVYDGTVEFRYNGDLIHKRPQAINPELNYSTVLEMQTVGAAQKYLGVAYFAMDMKHYAGPVLRG